MDKYFKYILFVFFGITSLSLNAQQDNLWTTEFGSRSALLSGAVTSSVRDNSAIYYNPGVLGFLKNSNIGLSASVASLYTTFIENGAGEGVNLYHPSFSVVPQFISGVIKFSPSSDFTFTYGIFTKHKSNLSFRDSHVDRKDLFPSIPGEEVYHSRYIYHSDINNTWFGFGAGYLLNPNWSVGASLFFSYKDDWSREEVETSVFDDKLDLKANTKFSREYRLNQLSMMLKLGVAYEDEYVNWGATITTTGMPTFIFTGALMHRNESSNIPGSKLHYYDIYNDWESAWQRYPWEFDTGVQFMYMGGVINLRMTYFTKVGAHSISEFGPESEVITNNTDGAIFPQRNSVWYASRSLFNFAVGYERLISDNVILLAGFKTDRNAFDSSQIDRSDLWTPTKSYWNLYSASFGFDFRTENHGNILIGVALKNSWRDGDKQIINLTDLDPNNHLLGAVNNNTRTNVTGASLIVGYTFTFKGSEKKDIRDKLEGVNPFLIKSKNESDKNADEEIIKKEEIKDPGKP